MARARLRLSSGAGRRGSGAFDADAEALQTDVMRFMALLGFVLVAIFALVQAIPTAATDAAPALERRADLRGEIEALERHVGERRRQLAALEADIAAARAAAERADERAQERRGELSRLTETARALQAALESERTRLASLHDELDASRRNLESVRSALERRRSALEQAESRFAALRSRLERTRAQAAGEVETATEADQAVAESPREGEERVAAAAAEREQGSGAAETATPAQEPRARSAQAATGESEPRAPARGAPDSAEAAGAEADQGEGVPERGFVLKFASETAFDRLVATARVDFYALVGKRAWQARRRGGGARFEMAPSPPSEYHEMRPATVPARYVEALRERAAVVDATTVTWAAVLPRSVERDVREAVAGKRAGQVVIQGDGRVRLENARP